MNVQVFTAIVFGAAYAYVMVAKRYVAAALWVGAAALAIVPLLFGESSILTPRDLFVIQGGSWASVNWNVMGIFAGTLLVAHVFIYSRVPTVLADLLIERSPNVCWALLGVCALSSFISIFAANVATVLIVAPVAIELAKKLDVSPAPFLIGIAICSNLQGTATLIGDPPSMILAAHYRMNFNDFFWHRGRVGIFFAVQAGAVASLLVLWLMWRNYRQPVVEMPAVKPLSWLPTMIIVVMILLLAAGSWVDPGFLWFGGVVCVLCGMVSVLWLYLRDRPHALGILKSYDWSTTFFLMGVFMMVYALTRTGIIDTAARWVSGVTGGSVLVAFILIVAFSMMLSAFVDNIPYLAAMLPLVAKLPEALPLEEGNMVLAYGLLIGSCLGGNITPVGASTNVVACGMLRQLGHDPGFFGFVKIGLPFTLAATAVGSLFIWLVWM